MELAVENSYSNAVKGRWSMKAADAFMTTEGLGSEMIKRVNSHTRNVFVCMS